jgi:hypothetical protein
VTRDKNGELKFDGASSGKDGSKSGKEKIDESATALAAYVRQLESATEKTLELTEVEKARIFLTTIGTTGEVAQVRELVLGMAAAHRPGKGIHRAAQAQAQLHRPPRAMRSTPTTPGSRPPKTPHRAPSWKSSAPTCSAWPPGSPVAHLAIRHPSKP